MNSTPDRESSRAVDLCAPELVCYRTEPHASEIVPARATRDWMDATDQRYAYRCLPLSMANCSGWEILTPFAFEAAWNGSAAVEGIEVRTSAEAARVAALIASHFGHGILTFHTGWLFRTSPGWALWVRGAPNTVKDGIQALDGLVETDWLPFPFTMNWRFTRPGTVRFAAGEPFCFITLCPHALLDAVAPQRGSLEDSPTLKSDYEAWSKGRAEFNRRLIAFEPQAVAQGWQKNYVRGLGAAGASTFHISKRRLKPLR